MNAPAESPLPPSLPTDLAAAHGMILAERQTRIEAQAEALAAKAVASSTEATIAHLKLMIENLKRELYGQRSERTMRLIDQMELQLEELEAKATEDELAAEAMSRQASLPAWARGRPVRKPFPEHLPRERVVIAAPTSCPCCGSTKLSKLGEDVTETLEVIPRQWKVIQTLNRQSERYGREGIDLSVSTLADLVGAATAALAPLHALIASHVMAAERLHADDTTVPILARSKTDTGRIWTYVRDDRPFGGADPPSALCWSHARRGFFELADIAASARRGPGAAPVSPIALEAAQRIDALFAVEREINGLSADERHHVRQERSRPLVDDLRVWLGEQRGTLSRSATVAKPIDYMLIRADGWKWVEAAISYPYGHTSGMRRIYAEPAEMSAEEIARYDAVKAEYDALDAKYAEMEDADQEIEDKLDQLGAELDGFSDRPQDYDPVQKAIAGAFWTLGTNGQLQVEAGFVRPEDEPRAEVDDGDEEADGGDRDASRSEEDGTNGVVVNGRSTNGASDAPEEPEEDGSKPLPERLVFDLPAQKTLALRNALASDVDIAFVTVLHALVLPVFHLIRSDILHSKQLKLFPFAMWRAFPVSDYYGNSASMVDIRVNSLGIPPMPSLVHVPDLKRIGEAAGRSLFPCFPQVDADAMVWLHSPHDPCETPYIYARIRMSPAYVLGASSAFRLLSRVGEGDISALRCE